VVSGCCSGDVGEVEPFNWLVSGKVDCCVTCSCARASRKSRPRRAAIIKQSTNACRASGVNFFHVELHNDCPLLLTLRQFGIVRWFELEPLEADKAVIGKIFDQILGHVVADRIAFADWGEGIAPVRVMRPLPKVVQNLGFAFFGKRTNAQHAMGMIRAIAMLFSDNERIAF
jgi:hypothetical protein